MESEKDQTRPQDESAVERERAAERGDVAEPDAPTVAEENEGLNTILSADPVDGVQDDDEEE
jgi:hypothetical protein